MKAIGITGFKNSGKTTLVALLAQALENMGRRVAVVKCTHHDLDLPGRDTSRLCAPGRPVAALGEKDAAIFWRDKMSIMDLLVRLPADIVLVEGGKNLTFLPRVLCLHDVLEGAMLAPELAVATFGAVSLPPLPSFDADTVDVLARLADKSAFVLGGLDCGLCGRESCAGLAADILAGKADPAHCLALVPASISLRVNGSEVPLNAFTARMLEGGLRGMLAPLKGMAPGTVEITLK